MRSTYTAKLIKVQDAAIILALDPKRIYNGECGTDRLTRRYFGRSVRLILQEVEALRDGKTLPK